MLCRFQRPTARAGGARAAPARTSRTPVVLVRAKTADAEAPPKHAPADVKAKKEEAESKRDLYDPTFSSKQVTDFLRTVVEETEFVDIELQIGTFELKVKRNVNAAPGEAVLVAAPAAEAAAPAQAIVEESPAAVTPPSAPLQSVDESMVLVVSNKVGIFRRGRYAAGKRVGKGNVIELGDQVKKGSPVGFIEQLGTHFPVEAPQTGELARFKLEDGAPVEYGQIVAEVAPFFGGELNVTSLAT
mmetsp:Transcript_912/g.2438  ORF Transcript_912/g.2438 Transcript_912/m.2438 type:complete len:244 (-) Transcript_912:178-909(-)